mmetsp:Transcript_52664/g.94535  ORF Transcript_52664/g.94535 Transcript_52664/m.94535 type:complete len:116 (-) Transcript_52664:307-654(-)|eukprot:CAMPEP_0197647390 /NCGR_PEP_ID=MMETSP1338-20131121/25148_1 /TAXON_ID=43686 ORGANISM="Pelagodinium beii, Strain RCC1491" /NCGR_SAMPLE_ID=MMETSP1338 /ASSEMBLY_ACC=CAM_ASM_000754 /LENGTH=115 /DNA_ID=CAMNT_0043221171 /DNA_START=151 /DNA_END=498 /DNA_ORIENTATION=+
MAGPMMLIAMQDLMQVLLVVTCVFAGWSLQTSACSFLMHKVTRPLKKTMEDDKISTCSKTDDSDDSEADAASGCKEVFVHEEDIPYGLKILEQYGIFGASPGAWTSRVAHKVNSL